MRTKDRGTDHVRVNLWLTQYKLTGWLALLNLAAPTQRLILIHQTRPPMPCLTYWFWTGGEINDLVDGDRELPANKRDPTHVPDSGEFLIHHHHIFSKTGTASTHTSSKSGMAAYQGGVVTGGVYRHHTFMCHKYHVNHTSKQCNLDCLKSESRRDTNETPTYAVPVHAPQTNALW